MGISNFGLYAYRFKIIYYRTQINIIDTYIFVIVPININL